MALLKKHKTSFDPNRLPSHVGIIMDGNGRWAKKRGLPRSAGHAVGVKVFKTIAFYARDIGIKNLTVYAFSTENWNRPKDEIEKIMQLLEEYIDEATADFESQKVRVRFLGDTSVFTGRLKQKMDRLEKLTEKFDKLSLNIAMNYGGQQEIVMAAQKIAKEAKAGLLSPQDITTESFSKYLHFSDLNSVDLIIRPSGELRLSNFLLWQCAYAEFWFSDVLWPDFKKSDLDRAIMDYQKRDRRFGRI